MLESAQIDPVRLIRPCRRISGASAILLPFDSIGEVDWAAFSAHLRRTTDAGLTPAVNMDTGYVNLIDDDLRLKVLRRTRESLEGRPFLAGAFVSDRPGSSWDRDAYLRQIETVAALGAMPVVFQSHGLTSLDDDEIIAAYTEIGRDCDRFVAFELGTEFAPFGRIYPLDVFRGLLGIRSCVGAKHSSLHREPEWLRLIERDRIRPDFRVYTGNDLAIDMVMYGSDYLLGLSTFAPDLFARRDAFWETGDPAFFELNDLLQYLGFFAFRHPVTAYKHSAAMFLHLRGWIGSNRTHPKSPNRASSDLEVLLDIGRRLGVTKEGWAMAIRRLASIKTPAEFRDHAASLGVEIPIDLAPETGPEAPLARPFSRSVGTIGNRFAILPMEGWDGLKDGRPSDLTRGRWRNFGRSGAKLIWGGEAVAVRQDGRANPNQLLINDANLLEIAGLRETLVDAHIERFGNSDDLLIGLQLTHSGRFARPFEKDKPEPRIAYRHPLLDELVGVRDDRPLLSDGEISRLVDDFVSAASLARQAGFGFVDIKHCHGYLGHEFLSAVDRPGRYGGNLENRGRFLREVVEGVRAEAPGLEIGVRLSVFDLVPFRPGPDGTGEPMTEGPYRHAFGGDGTGLGVDLTEVSAFLATLESLGIDLLCTTAGSPYYNPHVIRPAAFPPSDGYLPPEDPLIGVARQIDATAWLKARHPRLSIVGSGYSYLQDWLPLVGQRVVRDGGVDFVGLGRMVLSYPEMPSDVLAGRPLVRKRICRTFSDCTTAPRNGMVSGCYPLDPDYKRLPERERVNRIKRELADRMAPDHLASAVPDGS